MRAVNASEKLRSPGRTESWSNPSRADFAHHRFYVLPKNYFYSTKKLDYLPPPPCRRVWPGSAKKAQAPLQKWVKPPIKKILARREPNSGRGVSLGSGPGTGKEPSMEPKGGVNEESLHRQRPGGSSGGFRGEGSEEDPSPPHSL